MQKSIFHLHDVLSYNEKTSALSMLRRCILLYDGHFLQCLSHSISVKGSGAPAMRMAIFLHCI